MISEEECVWIVEVIDYCCGDLVDFDLVVFGYYEWWEGLLCGLVVYYVGMLLVFWYMVEELFIVGLVKVVFVIEILVFGINMLVCMVVLEWLVKFNGE